MRDRKPSTSPEVAQKNHFFVAGSARFGSENTDAMGMAKARSYLG